MRSIRSDQRARFSLLLLLVILTGCASSQPSKFYQLNPVHNQRTSIVDVPSSRNVVIAVGPVRIPDYLDRPQIVTRSGKNELKLSEFDRWVGSLEGDIGRVLVEDISSLFPADGPSVVRWTSYSESRAPASYRIEVLVDRFEGTPGDSVLLKALWRIFANDGSLLLNKESRFTEQIHGGNYDALVAAMSGALERLSLHISEGIRSVLRQAPVKE